MTDKGVLALPADADLSLLEVRDDGYSVVQRGSVILYPSVTPKGVLFFSRAPASPLSDNTPALVDIKASA